MAKGITTTHGLLAILVVSLLAAIVVFAVSYGTAVAPLAGPVSTSTATPLLFDGVSSMRYAQAQCDIGPRPPGTPEDVKTGDFIINSLPPNWKVVEQKFDFRGVPIRNVIARRGQGSLVIIGAHYDTRPRADNDPTYPNGRILGADDGASGVAVLLELSRVLPQQLNKEVWLAFFDAEDSGAIDNWPWSVGANYVAASLTITPSAVVVVDMVGYKDQHIYYEENSNAAIEQAIFADAAKLGYGAYFLPKVRYNMIDDHTPFLERGYPAVDLIDFDYPFWHTMKDTCDKIGPESLEHVGRTLQQWLAR